jgi:Protein of unknown function DUF72/Helix-hairpin-helix domain
VLVKEVCVTFPEEQWFVAEGRQRRVGPAKVRVVSTRSYIGTSGWHYDHWKGPFYPSDVPEKDFLGYYAGRFGTAEINNSFYRLPERENPPSVAEIFKKMADLLEIESESRYKIKAYRDAAGTVGGRSRTATLARG